MGRQSSHQLSRYFIVIVAHAKYGKLNMAQCQLTLHTNKLHGSSIEREQHNHHRVK